MVATVNLPDVPLRSNEIIVKDYSENEGVLDFLIKEDIVETPHKYVQLEFVRCWICKLAKTPN